MNSLESLEICPAIFQNWKKSGRMVNKSLEFFQSYNKYFIHVGEFCFVFLNVHVCLHCVVKKSFVPACFKVSIDHLFDNPESGKRNHSFEKKSGKSLEFWIQKSV